jgi:nucleoside-diphosphate kinase
MTTVDFFVMIKPDGVRRGLIGEIISRFEKKGFELVNIAIQTPTRELISAHYIEHSDKTFYDNLVDFGSSGPVVQMMWRGNIQVARQIVGATIPWDAVLGSIRGDYACSVPENLVHCSDSADSAERELKLWFGE